MKCGKCEFSCKSARIEKTIEWYEGLECYTPQAKNARDIAIETMRKYQKIQEIVENRNIKPPLTTLNRIIKVVEDGTV